MSRPSSSLEGQVAGERADEREFFLLALDDVDDAHDREDEGAEIDELYHHPQLPQESAKYKPRQDLNNEKHQALFSVEFYERVAFCNENRNNDENTEITQDTHERAMLASLLHGWRSRCLWRH